jgi:hypothetical protein
MRHRGECPPRGTAVRKLGLERLEDRRVLSSVGPSLDSQVIGSIIGPPPIAAFVNPFTLAGPQPATVDNGLGALVAHFDVDRLGLLGLSSAIAAPSGNLIVIPAPVIPLTQAAPAPTVVESVVSTFVGDIATEGPLVVPPLVGIRVNGASTGSATTEALPGPVDTQTASVESTFVGESSGTSTLAVPAGVGGGGATFGSASASGQVTAATYATDSGDVWVLASVAAIGGPPIQVPINGGQTAAEPGIEQLAYGTSLTISLNALSPTVLVAFGGKRIPIPGLSRASSPLAETPDGAPGVTANGAIELDPGDGAGIAVVGLPAVAIGVNPFGWGQIVGLGGLRASMVSAAAPAENLAGPAGAGGGGDCVVETSTNGVDPGEEGRGREDLVIPAPQRNDLMTVFRPLEGTAVGPMIDRLLEPMEYLGGGLPWLRGPTELVVELLAVGLALAAWKVVPRALGRGPAEDDASDHDPATSLDGISGFPLSSSLEEL